MLGKWRRLLVVKQAWRRRAGRQRETKRDSKKNENEVKVEQSMYKLEVVVKGHVEVEATRRKG